MNWYISKIVFRISAENTQHKPQFDEQLRLIAAESEGEAFLKARMIGISEEDSFLNNRNNTVKWEFINVSEVIALRNLEDGMEIYSQIHETDEARSYIHCVHQKAIFLRTHSK
ncbi:MAG: DUF4288 domain-containing protein [Bacteroidota bacterium]|nr:DUF4288 domain-containing protein [Bacteroidota bacterium]